MNNVEKQIVEYRDQYKFQTVDHAIERVEQMFNPEYYNETDETTNKKTSRFIPMYQREYVWSLDRSSYYIESIFLGIPTQYIFLAAAKQDNSLLPDDLEIVDGSQRIRTIAKFLKGEIRISNTIKQLTSLHGKTFHELPQEVQGRFKRRVIRVIEIENMNLNARRDLFKRLNEGVTLDAQEKRKGSALGSYYDFLSELAHSDIFCEICPMSASKINKGKNVEYVEKLFAYTELYEQNISRPTAILNEYMTNMATLEIEKPDEYEQKITEQRALFDSVCEIIKINIGTIMPGSSSISTQRFESIAVAIGVALKTKPAKQLKANILAKHIKTEEYIKTVTVSGGSNNRQSFLGRIEPIKNLLLGK